MPLAQTINKYVYMLRPDKMENYSSSLVTLLKVCARFIRDFTSILVLVRYSGNSVVDAKTILVDALFLLM